MARSLWHACMWAWPHQSHCDGDGDWDRVLLPTPFLSSSARRCWATTLTAAATASASATAAGRASNPDPPGHAPRAACAHATPCHASRRACMWTPAWTCMPPSAAMPCHAMAGPMAPVTHSSLPTYLSIYTIGRSTLSTISMPYRCRAVTAGHPPTHRAPCHAGTQSHVTYTSPPPPRASTTLPAQMRHDEGLFRHLHAPGGHPWAPPRCVLCAGTSVTVLR